MTEAIMAFFVFLPVAISLIVLSFNIRREFLYGTEYDVFRRDLFSGPSMPTVPEERDRTEH